MDIDPGLVAATPLHKSDKALQTSEMHNASHKTGLASSTEVNIDGQENNLSQEINDKDLAHPISRKCRSSKWAAVWDYYMIEEKENVGVKIKCLLYRKQ